MHEFDGQRVVNGTELSKSAKHWRICARTCFSRYSIRAIARATNRDFYTPRLSTTPTKANYYIVAMPHCYDCARMPKLCIGKGRRVINYMHMYRARHARARSWAPKPPNLQTARWAKCLMSRKSRKTILCLLQIAEDGLYKSCVSLATPIDHTYQCHVLFPARSQIGKGRPVINRRYCELQFTQGTWLSTLQSYSLLSI